MTNENTSKLKHSNVKQSTTATDLLRQSTSSSNADDNHKHGSTLIEYEKIEGTPFTMINQDEKWFIVMGDNRITEPTKTREEQFRKLKEDHWLITLTVAAIAIEKILEQKKQNQ